jgi:hypothetical protein
MNEPAARTLWLALRADVHHAVLAQVKGDVLMDVELAVRFAVMDLRGARGILMEDYVEDVLHERQREPESEAGPLGRGTSRR